MAAFARCANYLHILNTRTAIPDTPDTPIPEPRVNTRTEGRFGGGSARPQYLLSHERNDPR